MSLLNNNNNNKGGKKGDKNAKKSAPGSAGFIKPSKAAAFTKKPVKTGGTRGS
jgi:hypothetical protein